MTEIITKRMKRIFSGTVADIVESLEKGRAESVMREAIREVERAAQEARAEETRAAASRLQAARQAQMARDKIAHLGERARDALGQSREDLAKAAVSRQLDLENQLVALLDIERAAAAEESARAKDVAAHSARFKEMQESLAAYDDARRETEGAPASDAASPDRRQDRRVADSVAAFERSMKAVAGDLPTMTPIDADTTAKLAELDVLLRGQQIDARLAALKADRMKPFM